MPAPAVIRALSRADLQAFHALRTEALRLNPEAYGMSLREWEGLSEDEIAMRLQGAAPGGTFGAFADGTSLVGIAGLAAYANLKERHKALVWGVYVTAAHRGRGLASALLDRIIAHAHDADELEIVQLSVTVGNDAARALYLSRGFVPYGLKRRSLKLGPGDYRDEELMMLDLRGRAAAG
ncbi:GNAT family N-acetyltransferase [Chelatococcus sp. GCM10030263]|uniref:GNAT family N-acetyltransferase n=1 Tax=Chelatococcus sp. GCM10030263 TaxID=3273387 RepID=UPI00360E265F